MITNETTRNLRHFCRVAIAGLLLALSASQSAGATRGVEDRIDTRGIEQFWAVHDSLARGQEPTAEAWDTLFATPGYAVLETHEGRRNALQRAFRHAYRPDAASVDAPTGWAAMIQPHLARVVLLRDHWPGFREWLRRGTLLSQAAAQARLLFRGRRGVAFEQPPISFIVFSADARGYERLLLDPFHLMEINDPADFIAHEFFHAWRLPLTRWPDMDAEREPLAWLLANLENEGMADLLDKRGIPDMDDAALASIHPDPVLRRFYAQYRTEYQRAGLWLQQIDAALREATIDPARSKAVGGRLLKALSGAGRVVGAFMARCVIEHLGEAELAATIGDPAAFWRAYDRAAAVAGSPRLSAEAWQAIARIDQQFSRPADTLQLAPRTAGLR